MFGHSYLQVGIRLFTLGKQFVQQFIQTAFHALNASDLWYRFNIQITIVDIVNILLYLQHGVYLDCILAVNRKESLIKIMTFWTINTNVDQKCLK